MIAGFDFFTVPTVTFQLLYCFFVIERGRRKIRHFNLTQHPTAERVAQQLRKAFPGVGPLRSAILLEASNRCAKPATPLKPAFVGPGGPIRRRRWVAEANQGSAGGHKETILLM